MEDNDLGIKEGQGFTVGGDEEYFKNNPCGCRGEHYLIDAVRAVFRYNTSRLYSFVLYDCDGINIYGSFTIEKEPMIKYIADGVFNPVDGSVQLNTGSTSKPKNNDGRTFCYSCGDPVEDRQRFSSIYQVCTRCGL